MSYGTVVYPRPAAPAVVLGGGGMLAFELAHALRGAGWLTELVGRDACDVTDAASVRAFMERRRPRLVVNCAAYTRVDAAERESERAFAVNARGAAHVADAARAAGALLVHVSTNSVFDGTATRPYVESDTPHPQGVYATSKLEGELAVRSCDPNAFIVRTGHLYGANGNNFIDKLLRQVRAGTPIRVVDDQIVSPTWTRDVAAQIARIVELEGGGTFHVMAEGEVSWFDAARRISELLGLDVSITAVSTSEFNAPAPRPPYGVLANNALRRAGICQMRAWDVALAEYLRGLRV